jgi:ATP-dependent helicase/nuclease subunit B
MSSTNTLEALLDSLEKGEPWLLPNARAAREARAAYDMRQRAKGLGAWEPARALSWQQWADGLYSELIVAGSESRLLLNAAQELSLWRAVIEADPPTESLTGIDSLAELAMSGFQLAAAWNATRQLKSSATSEDNRIFARWAESFEERCRSEQCVSRSLLDTALTKQLEANTAQVPETLRLAGFGTFTPAQESLLATLRAHGTAIDSVSLTTAVTKLHAAVLAETPRDELRLAALWLREHLEQAEPTSRIAVLVPGLEQERAQMETVLRAVLAPELEAINEDLSSTPWEFSVGEPLQSLAMIADAMDVLRLGVGPLPQQRVSALLLSPYLNPGGEREIAAQLDARIRSREKRLRPEISLTQLLSLIEKHKAGVAWPRQLATEIGRGGDIARPRSYAAWMELLRGWVQATGWPSAEARALNAVEFEATRAWDAALDTVSTLDFMGHRVALKDALQALERQVQSTAFMPPATNAPVQVMRPAEVEGAFFDAVLFLRATGENWPAAERTHPLLSWQLQSSLGMPGTDPVRSAARAREFTKALLERTPTVVFTHATADKNGELRTSPLLDELEVQRLGQRDFVADMPEEKPVASEIFEDSGPLPSLPSAEVHGGSRLLQLQAACGFRAFAEIRLNSSEPDTAEIGFDAMESGNLVHGVLQELWTRVKKQSELAAMTAEQRRALLEQCIETALRKQSANPEIEWDHAYLSVMQERLLRLMEGWLQLELRRSPFEVQAVERQEEIDVGPLRLKVRVDRIDRTKSADSANEGSVLIDYKTGGSAHPKQWETPRPEEPQLPLYTLLFEPGEVKAIAFGKLLAGEQMRWIGMQAETGILPKDKPKSREVTTNLELQVEQWRDELIQLAHDFADGRADVSPKEWPVTCTYCAQRILCRVGEVRLYSTGRDDTEDGDE